MKKIKLTQGRYALVDNEDYLYLNRFKWTLNEKKTEQSGNTYEYEYACKTIQRNKKQIQVYMFEFLIEAINYECVVFKNKNTLDYRKSNLGLVSYGVRGTMAKKRIGTYSKYKGLTYRPKKKVFEVRICKDKKTYCLGKFENEIEGALAYNRKAKELYGEFAYQNNINN